MFRWLLRKFTAADQIEMRKPPIAQIALNRDQILRNMASPLESENYVNEYRLRQLEKSGKSKMSLTESYQFRKIAMGEWRRLPHCRRHKYQKLADNWEDTRLPKGETNLKDNPPTADIADLPEDMVCMIVAKPRSQSKSRANVRSISSIKFSKERKGRHNSTSKLRHRLAREKRNVEEGSKTPTNSLISFGTRSSNDIPTLPSEDVEMEIIEVEKVENISTLQTEASKMDIVEDDEEGVAGGGGERKGEGDEKVEPMEVEESNEEPDSISLEKSNKERDTLQLEDSNKKRDPISLEDSNKERDIMQLEESNIERDTLQLEDSNKKRDPISLEDSNKERDIMQLEESIKEHIRCNLKTRIKNEIRYH